MIEKNDYFEEEDNSDYYAEAKDLINSLYIAIGAMNFQDDFENQIFNHLEAIEELLEY